MEPGSQIEGVTVTGIEKALNKFVLGLEIAVSAALVVIAALLVVTLAVELTGIVTGGLTMDRSEFTRIISTALEVFIVIELFRIALAYMKHSNVIPTVFEAALVAVARKFVVFEPKEDYLQTALALAALLLAIGISWWLFKKSQARELDEIG
ncbi:MAG: phosphate-starvation-inducible PsiE family protein [Coriobacteriia bacterium]|nr:phosphate-starvation-inducible PsiE family protein [Coriobacteriia bacterium]